MIRLLPAVVAASMLVAGCGGADATDGSAGKTLRATSAHLGDISSADLHLRLVLEPRDGDEGGRAGFALDGPLALARRGRLPKARLRYTQIAGTRTGGATFISDGTAAFVDTGDGVYALGAARSDALRAGAEQAAAGVELPIGRWIRSSRTESPGTIDGVAVDHVSATLDAVAALRDIFGAAADAGASVPDLRSAKADVLRKAVDDASLEVWTGKRDKLLRRLRIRLAFHADVPESLKARLGTVAGGRFAFDVGLADVNAPVEVDAPSDVVGELPAPAG